jgi:hypothetical protein
MNSLYLFSSFLIISKIVVIKKKAKIAAKNVHEYLQREPTYIHPRLKFIPNVIVNGISLFIALALISGILYLLFHFITNAFYHLK